MKPDRIICDEVSTAGTDEFLDTPAFAAPAAPADHANAVAVASPKGDPDPTFGTAFWTFIDGGADLGRGAAEIIAGAYTGLALTPALIAHSFSCGGGCC